ncbi:MAG: tRNA (guanine(10)-N(2))-dimethyltransferase [Candidatus Hadarchaeales archaeon]
MMGTERVREGKVVLEVPELSTFRAPSGDFVPSLTKVFYNPHMEFGRDIGVAAVSVFGKRVGELRICDPLAGVGVRGIRYAAEVDGVREVIVNDVSEEAYRFLCKNISLNSLSNVVACREEAHLLLWKNRRGFQVVDLDPFGSPSPFLEASCVSLSDPGMLALTATDTACLAGTYPMACFRKYGALPLRTEYAHELGLRILIGHCQRVAGVHGLSLLPLLSHSTRHYFRVYLLLRRGGVNRMLKGQGYLLACRCGRRTISHRPEGGTCECGRKREVSGPMWLGNLWEKEFVEEVLKVVEASSFRLKAPEVKMLRLCAEEAGGPPFFYDSHGISRRRSLSPPKLERILEGLRRKGYLALRTHFSPTGFRTDAPFEEIEKLFSS